MADWVTISSLATAGGTLVLAIATFSSTRSSNRSARVAERSLMEGLRPVLIPSREEDPVERIRFGDRQLLIVPGHGAAVALGAEAIYLAMALRNGGSGLAVIHGWRVEPRPASGTGSPTGGQETAPDLAQFTRQQLDLYIPAGDTGYWLGALRDPRQPIFRRIREATEADELLQVDVVYGDHEGGQRTIVRFVISPWSEDEGRPAAAPEGRRASTLRYWNVDRDDPRHPSLQTA